MTPQAAPAAGTIDCDVHNAVPDIAELFPFLPDRWRDYCVEHGVTSLAPASYPSKVPLSATPESRGGPGPAGSDPDLVRAQVLDRGADLAILNCLYAVQPIHNEDWAAAMASALNDWQAQRWLAADPRFRASIVVAQQFPQRAVAEIERFAGHPGFVQVLLLAGSQAPLGTRAHWPIHAAAARAGLPVGIHPGVAGGNPPSPVGWPSTYIEEYAGATLAMQSQLTSLVCEGVFARFPELTVVLLESGVTWLPSLMWRLDKNWKGLRREIPWVGDAPSAVIRRHVRLATAPFDGPHDAATARRFLPRFLDQIGSVDMLLHASDHPHWHHRDPEQALLGFLSADERRKVLRDNALATYPAIRERAAA
ncbi:amidohydrolase family protein [Pseudonocardia bannensis]|uniref:Amidohydrolase n=1 Tax=Pseudonocardia bannensis TaxID=630973 RepID=A0A848DJ48_9PSEU|nr:amidohydrolase family protein [Pseudonocardia bannensis]NMH92708.1 amidohydrolase [Pseudonocardia bannensis]